MGDDILSTFMKLLAPGMQSRIDPRLMSVIMPGYSGQMPPMGGGQQPTQNASKITIENKPQQPQMPNQQATSDQKGQNPLAGIFSNPMMLQNLSRALMAGFGGNKGAYAAQGMEQSEQDAYKRNMQGIQTAMQMAQMQRQMQSERANNIRLAYQASKDMGFDLEDSLASYGITDVPSNLLQAMQSSLEQYRTTVPWDLAKEEQVPEGTPGAVRIKNEEAARQMAKKKADVKKQQFYAYFPLDTNKEASLVSIADTEAHPELARYFMQNGQFQGPGTISEMRSLIAERTKQPTQKGYQDFEVVDAKAPAGHRTIWFDPTPPGKYIDPVTKTEFKGPIQKYFQPSSFSSPEIFAGARQIAEDIRSGLQPPTTTGLYRYGGPVRVELAKMDFDLVKAQNEWNAVQKWIAASNSTQQLRLRQAVEKIEPHTDVIENIYSQLETKKLPTGYKAWNRLALAAARNVPGETGALAQNLETQIIDLSAELGNVYMGGNTPTDHALQQARQNLMADWNPETFHMALDLIRKNVVLRRNAIRFTGPAGAPADSPYYPSQSLQPTGPLPSNKAATKADIQAYATRYNLSMEQATKEFTDKGYVIR